MIENTSIQLTVVFDNKYNDFLLMFWTNYIKYKSSPCVMITRGMGLGLKTGVVKMFTQTEHSQMILLYRSQYPVHYVSHSA